MIAVRANFLCEGEPHFAHQFLPDSHLWPKGVKARVKGVGRYEIRRKWSGGELESVILPGEWIVTKIKTGEVFIYIDYSWQMALKSGRFIPTTKENESNA